MPIPRSGRIASVAAELPESKGGCSMTVAAEELRDGGDLPTTADPNQIINRLSA
jgi:hypothetical protein